MLVYEHVSNGSLDNVLHGSGTKPRALPLPARLDIAIGSAAALAYMHSHDGHDLVHGDVKSGNILLGDNLTPKVSDFGTSKLASIARHANSWCVVADRSYLDPVYMKTGRFTEKSDVYSFGVVLLEPITRKKAKYDGDKSLPVDFIKSCKEDGNGRAMYDREILSGEDAESHRYMECVVRIAALAVRCLKEDLDGRPTMAEVVEELKLAKISACGDSSSDDASQNHTEEAGKACMLMSMSLRQGRSQRASSPVINSNKQCLSIALPESHRSRLTPRRQRGSALAIPYCIAKAKE